MRCAQRHFPWCRTLPSADLHAAFGGALAGTRNRPSSACSSRAAPHRASDDGRLRAPAPHPPPPRSGIPSPREFAVRLRITLESSTTRQFFISPSLHAGPHAVPVQIHAALAAVPSTSTRSRSSTTMSFPSNRCTPADTCASVRSKLMGLSSKLRAGSFRTSPTLSIRRP